MSTLKNWPAMILGLCLGFAIASIRSEMSGEHENAVIYAFVAIMNGLAANIIYEIRKAKND